MSVTSAPPVLGDVLTIAEIQWVEEGGDASTYNGETVDCPGGIVVDKWWGGAKPRLILQDPNAVDGWAAIQLKDWTLGGVYDHVMPGDWLEFSDVLVEEFVGTTFLHYYSYDPMSNYSIRSPGNSLPPPVLVPVSAIPAPLEGPSGEWHVEDHGAEPYESMRLIVRNVTVTEINLGRKVDNYSLQSDAGDNCWAADYMNEDVVGFYHPFVRPQQHFCAVAGLFEQNSKWSTGWDYYQLVTRRTVDLAICGDGDSDGDVDVDDAPRFAECFIGPECEGLTGGCDPPAWTRPCPGLDVQACLMMDLDYDGDVDLRDFAVWQVIFGNSALEEDGR